MSTLDTSNVLISQNTTKLTKAAQDLAKVVESITSSAAVQESVLQEIAVKETELKALDVLFAEEERRRDVEFNINLKANQLKTVTDVLQGQGKIAVDQPVFTQLQADFVKLKAEFDTAVKNEVAKSNAIVKSQYDSAIKQKELELQVSEADTKSKISSLQDRNALLFLTTTAAVPSCKQIKIKSLPRSSMVSAVTQICAATLATALASNR